MSVESPRDDLLYRAKIELICLGRTLMPDDETLERTIGTLALFVVWAAIVLGPMFTNADPPRYEISIGTTAIAFTILGKMWDFEVKRALEAAVPISTDGGQAQSRDDDRED
ncbi:hypothetical protein [Natrinema pallidum]|uniref:Uncharacterized protein n=1 Tax=Natrinema pallidum TaxID=69527 RepID=A0A4P9TFF8_9EURY|nr:hypothetical protein [Natrinema pallidum]QCW03558.1 hypothetical protein FGF80_10040 [Natrinema pallidum]